MNEQTLTNRIVGGLSYLAVLFLPVLFPLIFGSWPGKITRRWPTMVRSPFGLNWRPS